MDDDNDSIIIPEVYACESKSTLWLPMLYGLKGLLLLFGVFLAWETRNVKIPALNDSKNIGLCIYNVFTMSAVGLVITMLIPANQVVAVFLVPCICIILSTTGTICIIFLPKVVDVLKGHEIGRVSVMPTVSGTFCTTDGTGTISKCMGTCPEAMKLRELLRGKEEELKEK
ncbi:hypothetical protein ScPMuIL_018564 [Solemya velum]